MNNLRVGGPAISGDGDKQVTEANTAKAKISPHTHSTRYFTSFSLWDSLDRNRSKELDMIRET